MDICKNGASLHSLTLSTAVFLGWKSGLDILGWHFSRCSFVSFYALYECVCSATEWFTVCLKTAIYFLQSFT